MNILLGCTGSVATVLSPKLAFMLQSLGDVRIVMTENAWSFVDLSDLEEVLRPGLIYCEEDEWTWKGMHKSTPRRRYQKNDRVLHIELRKWADAFVIAPLSANTLASMANGACPNLLTSIFRAWDWDSKSVVVAPAMNTLMWKNPITEIHLGFLSELYGERFIIAPPQSKMLACEDEGEGALAEIDDIIRYAKKAVEAR